MIAALKWLARHQYADGSWTAGGYTEKCTGAGRCTGYGATCYDEGVTALALLAFLGAGYTHLSREDYGPVVRKAIQWLISRQDAEGCIGRRGPKYMYNHAIAALALSEAYGLTGAAILKDPAQRAIDFLVAAQNPGRAWRYTARPGENDTSVTGWAVMALKSAELTDLSFPRAAYDGALAWIKGATDGGRVGYTGKPSGRVIIPNRNEDFEDHATMSAIGVMTHAFIERKRDPAAKLLLDDLPTWGLWSIDYYYWYYGSIAAFQVDGPQGFLWAKWSTSLKEALVRHQRTPKDGCRNGSWDPEVDRWGTEGGRVYATAVNALSLEVYYRYANVFGGRK